MKKSYKLNLTTVSNVQDFVRICSKFPFDIDVARGRYVIDAKSIMGMFSIDLSKPVDCCFDCDGLSIDDIKAFEDAIAPFII